MEEILEEIENEQFVCISNWIRELGIPVHYNGYRYLRSAVILGLAEPTILTSFTRKLYPKVASEYKVTSTSVDRSIRNGIDYAWVNHPDKINAFVGHDCEKKPTNSEIISIMVDNMKLKIAEDKEFSSLSEEAKEGIIEHTQMR